MLEVSSLFAQLPDDIIIWILSYGNQIKYRRGKFMSQILPNDYRMELLRKIPRPIHILPLLEISNTDDEDTIDFHNDKKNRVYISLKNGKKEMIHHCFTKENHYYYEYIYIAKGRMIGYAHKILHLIDVFTNSKGSMYNQYTIIDVD
jgi:hypothetical protein